MVEMTVAGIALDATNRNPIILLRDPSGRRQVPIWIDHAQARNIIAGIQNPNNSTLVSHDLMISLLDAGNLFLKHVIIHEIEETTFRAALKLSPKKQMNPKGEEEANCLIEIEARPSDAIALAVRSKCSIWMLENVVAEASIPVDPEADKADQESFRSFLKEVNPSDLISYLKGKGAEDE